MKTSTIAMLAMACAGASHAAPTTLYFSGTTYGYQYIDAVSGAAMSTDLPRAFSGSVTVDGRNGSPWSVLGFPAEVQGAEIITNSQCAVSMSGACSGTNEPPVPTNLLAFSMLFEGKSYAKWTLPLPGGVETSGTVKLQGPTVSQYTASGGVSGQSVVATLPAGERTLYVSQSINATLVGSPGAIGDLLDLAQLPDLAQVDVAASEVNFWSFGYTCTVVDGGCQDTVFDADALSFQGRLSYLGMVPQAVAEVPEPASAALMLAGIAGLFGW